MGEIPSGRAIPHGLRTKKSQEKITEMKYTINIIMKYIVQIGGFK